MTLAERLEQIRSHMGDFLDEIKSRLSNVLVRVPHLDDAQTLEDMTSDMATELLRQKIRQHIATLGQNVHGTTPADLGTYGSAKIDGDLAALLDVNSSAPLSFYGDREYLPPSVTGSFESAMNWAPYGTVGMFLEDNGTLMILRTGTDGSSAGVYYSYVRNALNTTRLESPVMTNTRYSPAYFPSTLQAMSVLYSNDDVIIGLMMNKSTGARAGYFISLTNNTFDQTKHTGIIIPEGNFLDVRQADNLTLRGCPCAFIKGSKLWIMTRVDYTAADVAQLRWRVWSLNKNDLISGVFNGATQEKGWTINRGAGGTITSDDLLIVNNYTDVVGVTDSNALSLGNANVSIPLNYAKLLSSGKAIMMGQWYINCHKVDNSLADMRVHLCFEFEIPDNKVIDVSKYFVEKLVYGYTASSLILTNAPAQFRSRAVNGWQVGVDGDNAIRAYFAENGVVFTHHTWVAKTGRIVQMHKMASTNLEDIFADRVSRVTNTSSPFLSRFASSVSFQMRSIGNIGDSVQVGANQNWYNNAVVDGLAYRVGYTSSLSYTYKSIGGFNVLGFAPTADRAFLRDLSATVKDPRTLVNESDAGGSLVHQGRFDITFNTATVKYAAVDGNLNGSGNIIIAPSARDGLLDTIVAGFTALGVTIRQNNIQPYPGEINRWLEVVVPQRYTDLPPFCYGVVVDTTGTARVFIATLNLSGTRQQINGLTVDLTSVRSWTVSNTMNNVLYLNRAYVSSPQIAIRRVTGGFVLGIIPSICSQTTGDHIGYTMLLKYQGGWSSFGNVIYNHPNSSPVGFLNFPTHGMFLCASAENERWTIDSGTKLVGTLVATSDFPTDTLDNYMIKVGQPANVKVMLSEETVTAWTVYFADPTAAMVDGLYQEVPLTSFTLNPTTDANKMIYVWLTRLNGVLSYLLTQSIAIPTGYEGQLYLGYIQTNSSGIAVINVTKRVAIGGKLLSPDARGQAVPLTSGVPATAGRFNWR